MATRFALAASLVIVSIAAAACSAAPEDGAVISTDGALTGCGQANRYAEVTCDFTPLMKCAYPSTCRPAAGLGKGRDVQIRESCPTNGYYRVRETNNDVVGWVKATCLKNIAAPKPPTPTPPTAPEQPSPKPPAEPPAPDAGATPPPPASPDAGSVANEEEPADESTAGETAESELGEPTLSEDDQIRLPPVEKPSKGTTSSSCAASPHAVAEGGGLLVALGLAAALVARRRRR